MTILRYALPVLLAGAAGCSLSRDEPTFPTSTSSPTPTRTVTPLPTPEWVATGQASPYALVVDANYVYWSGEGDLAVYRMAKTTATPQAVLGTLYPVRALCDDATYVYAGQSGTSGPAQIWRIHKVLGTAAAISASAADVVGIASDGSRVFWTDAVGSLSYAPVTGGPSMVLATFSPTPGAIAVDGSYAYVSHQATHSLYRVHKGTGTVFALSGPPPWCGPWGAAASGPFFYFTEQICGRVCRIPVVGGAPEVLGAGFALPQACVTDGTSVYFVERAGGSVGRLPAAGNTLTLLATGQFEPVGLGTDATHVYWTERQGGAVRRTPR